MPSDGQLLLAYVQDGSQEAFAEVVRRHLPLVYRAALRQLHADAHKAQDVSQIVFTVLAGKAATLARHPNLPGWLYMTTHHTACRVLRAETRRRERERDASLLQPETLVQPNADATWSDVAPLLDESIQALPARDRDAILRRFLSQQSFADIGTALNLREDAVRMRVDRALEKLRELLKRRGVEATPTALAGMVVCDTELGAPAGLVQSITASAVQMAPAYTSIGATLFGLMASTKLITTGAVLAAVAAVGLATQQSQAVQSHRAELQVAQAELAAARARVAAVSRPPSRVTAPAPRAVPPDLVEPEFESGRAFLSAHPDLRQALVQAETARVRGKFLPLYRELDLSEDQIAAFEQIVIGLRATVRPGVGILSLAERRLRPEEQFARIAAVLGERGLARYQATLAVRAGDPEAVAQKLAERLAFTAQPLDPRQSAAVVASVQRARTDSGNEDFWANVLPELQSVLTPAQMQELDGIVASDRYIRAEAAAAPKNQGSTRRSKL